MALPVEQVKQEMIERIERLRDLIAQSLGPGERAVITLKFGDCVPIDFLVERREGK